MKSFFNRCCSRYQVVCCVVLAVVFSNIHVAGARQAHSVPDELKSDRVSQLIRKMTIEEKVAQLRVFHSNLGVELDKNGKLELSDEVKDKLKAGLKQKEKQEALMAFFKKTIAKAKGKNYINGIEGFCLFS